LTQRASLLYELFYTTVIPLLDLWVANALLVKKRTSTQFLFTNLLLVGLSGTAYFLELPTVISVFLFAAAVFYLFDKKLIFKVFIIITILTMNCFLTFLIAPLAEHIFGYMTDGYLLICSLFLILVTMSLVTFSLRSGDLRQVINLFYEITQKAVYIYLIAVLVSRVALKVIAHGGEVMVMPITAVSAAEIGYTFYFTAVGLAFWCFTAPFFSLKQNYEKMKYKADAEITARILQNERNYFETISAQYELMRRYKHDIKYSMSVITSLANSKKTEAILEYIGEIEEPDVPPRFCDNVAVNALIDDYKRRFSKLGAEFSVSAVLPEDITVSSYELCILLGNILENAIEAIVKADRREVSLQIRISGKMLIIRVSNSYNGDIKKSGQVIVTTKQNGGGHGLRSIQSIVEKNGGNVSVAYNEKDFTISLLIPV
jgi:signal transduction histidine kinase